MDIRKRYTKVCLFLWVIGMCFCAHPIKAQSVIPVPLKMEQGTGSFLLSEKTKEKSTKHFCPVLFVVHLQGLEPWAH